MKKIIAIVVISITCLVTGYNLYQFATDYGHDKLSKPVIEQPTNKDKSGFATFIALEFFMCLYGAVRYIIWLLDKWEYKDPFYQLFTLDSGEMGSWMVFVIFCGVNGLAIFAIVASLIEKVI